MKVYEKEVTIPALTSQLVDFDELRKALAFHLRPNEVPIRFSVIRSDENHYNCEVGVIADAPGDSNRSTADLLGFRRRDYEAGEHFNAIMLVPTGIGAEIGGHAGDATAVARLLAGTCDNLLLHPNVVNGSDINELPSNAWYVEGSIITRFLMGTVGLQRVRKNRLLVLIDDHPDVHFVNAAVNTVNAARATYGLDSVEVVCLNPPIRMFAEYAGSGRAVGRVEGLDSCLELLSSIDDFDALALSSVIRVPLEYHLDYFKQAGKMINPWGGVEAMLTHCLSAMLDLPTAHAPMFESKKIENLEPGIVDPRMAAEAVSVSFLQCVLKGLHQSPKIIRCDRKAPGAGVLSAEDISCLVIPDGCLGLPTLAALEQGIQVIAVRENRNLMKNDLARLPWKKGQFIQVDNYLEAAGALSALKAGLTLESLRRPLMGVKLSFARERVGYADSATKTDKQA